MKQRYLITGANGFIGRRLLAKVLEESQNEALILSRSVQSDDFCDSRIQTIKTDLLKLSHQDLRNILKQVDHVIHLAWCMDDSDPYSSPNNLNHLLSCVRLGQAAKESGITSFSGIGTCLEYGHLDSPADTSTPLAPVSAYAKAKAAAYLGLAALFADQPRTFSWFRLYQVYHDKEPSTKLIPYLRSQISKGQKVRLSSGEQVRDFIHVDQACAMIWQLHKDGFSGAANICSGKGVSIKDKCFEIAGEYQAEHLLEFNARKPLVDDPPYLVGIPSSTYSIR